MYFKYQDEILMKEFDFLKSILKRKIYSFLVKKNLDIIQDNRKKTLKY